MTAILVVVMAVMPAIGIAVAARTWLRSRDSVHVVARVTGHVRESLPTTLDAEYSSRDLPVVEWTDESGKRRRATLREELRDTDKSVPLMYPRGRPQEARVDRAAYLYLVPALLIGPGLCLALVYLALSLYAAFAP